MNYGDARIEISSDDLHRRVLIFWFSDRNKKLLLDIDRDESRVSRRHKWKIDKEWRRVGRSRSAFDAPREIPQEIIDQALEQFRSKITYAHPLEF